MANIITCVRIICSAALVFCPALSAPFYCFYIAAGVTDMIDGTVARGTGTVSEFGSNLDTVADFILVAVCLVKLIPVLEIEKWMYVWIGIIVIIKIINIISGFVLQKKFVTVHSAMNKITGGLLFALPFTIRFIELRYSIIIVCAAATFAAIQEGHYIRKGKYEKKQVKGEKMKKVKITVKRMACYDDLIEQYENPIEHACGMKLGQVFVANGWQKPDGFCDSAWDTVSPFVMALSHGAKNFYDGWMKNERSAMISCNDGFRPVSFLLESTDEDAD